VLGTLLHGFIGTPFIRGADLRDYMFEFTDYLPAAAKRETGRPVAGRALYLGDDLDHKPRCKTILLPSGYKFDYINFALVNRSSRSRTAG
jgi:hypothetical protein